MALQWPDKDPNETLDYRLNWRARFPAGDSIVTSTWSDPTTSTLVKDASTYTTYTTTLWLSAGAAGETETFTNTIVTAQGRTLEQSVSITLVEK